jgi:hypothetical protein
MYSFFSPAALLPLVGGFYFRIVEQRSKTRIFIFSAAAAIGADSSKTDYNRFATHCQLEK